MLQGGQHHILLGACLHMLTVMFEDFESSCRRGVWSADKGLVKVLPSARLSQKLCRALIGAPQVIFLGGGRSHQEIAQAVGKVQRAVALQRLREEDVGIADIEKHLYTQVCGLTTSLPFSAPTPVPLGTPPIPSQMCLQRWCSMLAD